MMKHASASRRFEAELYALTKEEGGRHTPFFSNYRPQFFFRTADVTGAHGMPRPLVNLQPKRCHVIGSQVTSRPCVSTLHPQASSCLEAH